MSETKYQVLVSVRQWDQKTASTIIDVKFQVFADALGAAWIGALKYTKTDVERFRKHGPIARIEMQRLEDGFIVSKNVLKPTDLDGGESWAQTGWVDILPDGTPV
jgi:hypothetical protein